jgi:uncharacterized phage protein (TIGR01671 family)
MREIKFRAWDNQNQKMINNAYYIRGFHILSHIEGDFILMQYTGLKDKNGKEIYEGDICKTYGHDDGFLIDQVIFEDGSFLFTNPLKLSVELRGFKKDYIEVIGNIHENPELIKE